MARWQAVEDMDVVKAIEAVGTDSGAPKCKVIIKSSGVACLVWEKPPMVVVAAQSRCATVRTTTLCLLLMSTARFE
jgi:hypothetical protein